VISYAVRVLGMIHSSDGRCMAFTSTEPYEVWIKLMILHRGLTQTTVLLDIPIYSQFRGLGNASIHSPI